jgi:hypothetical protein
MTPAYRRYAAPSTALTLMNEKELRHTSDSLAVLVRIEKLGAQMADGVPKCVGVSIFIFFIREVSVVG